MKEISTQLNAFEGKAIDVKVTTELNKLQLSK